MHGSGVVDIFGKVYSSEVQNISPLLAQPCLISQGNIEYNKLDEYLQET